MNGMSIGKTICLILLVIGGLNWGLIGLMNFDLVEYLFGTMTPLTRIVYTLVGFAALGIMLTVPATTASQTKQKAPPQA